MKEKGSQVPLSLKALQRTETMHMTHAARVGVRAQTERGACFDAQEVVGRGEMERGAERTKEAARREEKEMSMMSSKSLVWS